MVGDAFFEPRALQRFVRRFRIEPEHRPDLAAGDIAPGTTCDFLGKAESLDTLACGTLRLADLQDRMWAEQRHGLLVVLQARDAAGKDSTIKHVMTGVNPQGVDVRSFSVPNRTELAHDFLWRHMRAVPERGRLMIHNRSHYEEVLVAKVHPDLLALRSIDPETGSDPGFWRRRYEDICAWERYLSDNNIHTVKLMLNVSKHTQLKRLLERIERPDKNWKFDLADVRERDYWDEYEAAYEDAIAATSMPTAPWYVVPADHKWFTRLAVTAILVETLERIDPQYPVPSQAQLADIEEGRRLLDAKES